MILYKYMTFDSAQKVLESNSIGFAKPYTFNDPFELVAGYPIVESSINPIYECIEGFRSSVKRFTWSDSNGVLCLTRNPLNPLMWAHYANQHEGVVLGIDIEKAGFLNSKNCLIPAQFGSVIYTNTRPTYQLAKSEAIMPLKVTQTFHYHSEHAERLQRLFLYKSACWAYEEEVRVVKCLSDRDALGRNKSGTFEEFIISELKTLYSFKLPEGAITEIYFGLRHPFLLKKEDERLENFKAKYPNLIMRKCYLSSRTWNIETTDLS